MDSLWALLPVSASTLEIREIFQRMSAIAGEVLPHDAVGIQIFHRQEGMIRSHVVVELVRKADEPEGFHRCVSESRRQPYFRLEKYGLADPET